MINYDGHLFSPHHQHWCLDLCVCLSICILSTCANNAKMAKLIEMLFKYMHCKDPLVSPMCWPSLYLLKGSVGRSLQAEELYMHSVHATLMLGQKDETDRQINRHQTNALSLSARHGHCKSLHSTSLFIYSKLMSIKLH